MENAHNLDRNKLSEEETRLIAPCGIYCGACDIFLGKSRDLASEMYRIIDGFNFKDVGPFFMGMEHEKITDFLNILRRWGEGSSCPTCLEGGGNPSCPVRVCSHKQGFLTCAECERMPCSCGEENAERQSRDTGPWLELVTKRYSHWNLNNLDRVREVGYRHFVDEMEEKVRNGFMTSDVISGEMVVTEALKKMENQG